MSIFNCSDIKGFLRKYISQLPKKGRGEISRIASHLRVSTTLVSQVLAGKKSFTAEQAKSLTTYLGLTGLDADYFVFMVQHERAGSTELQKFWYGKLSELRRQSLKFSNRLASDRILAEEERSIFYSNPLYSAIRLFSSVGAKGKSLDEICHRFELSRAKASEMMRFLTECGLCIEREGHFLIGAQKTHIEQGSPHLLRHYCNWRIRAIHQSELLTDQELMFSAPVSLSKKDFEYLREEMADFIKRFLDKVHASPAEEIACFNLDFFWIRK